jgi:hypothetical protein
MPAPATGAYMSLPEVMRGIVAQQRANPRPATGVSCRIRLKRAGLSDTSYKRFMRDPDYWRRMDVENLDRLLRGLGFDLMVCVGPASLLKVPPRD